jgi:hypothetical protein
VGHSGVYKNGDCESEAELLEADVAGEREDHGSPFVAFMLPAIWFLGYLVAGLRLGTLIYSQAAERVRGNRYLAVVTGLAILQLFALVPFLGIFVAVLMGFWGAGAVVLLAWRSFRTPRDASPALAA